MGVNGMVLSKTDMICVLSAITTTVGMNLVTENDVAKYVNCPCIELDAFVKTLVDNYGTDDEESKMYHRQQYLYTIYHLHKEGYIVFTKGSNEFVYDHDYERCVTVGVEIQDVTLAGHKFLWENK